ncbi:MAG: hypothetical protein FIA91_09235 [Geobacter sp.]|nr:hypothetical protein [Geobacter sp.]
MPDPLNRLKSRLQEQGVDPALMDELAADYGELRHQVDRLELLLITIVRAGWPWDGEGEPNAIHGAVKDGYTAAMLEAKELLGLGLNTMINRTEPKT